MDTRRITPEEVTHLLARGDRLRFLDARPAEAWDASERKLPGAMRVCPDGGEQLDACLSELPRGAATVVYCATWGEAASEVVAARLCQLGATEVFALAGGFEAWVDRGLPTEMKAAMACLEDGSA